MDDTQRRALEKVAEDKPGDYWDGIEAALGEGSPLTPIPRPWPIVAEVMAAAAECGSGGGFAGPCIPMTERVAVMRLHGVEAFTVLEMVWRRLFMAWNGAVAEIEHEKEEARKKRDG